MSAIEVRNLVKKFHGQTVLHGIDLDVKPGEWWSRRAVRERMPGWRWGWSN